MNILFDVGHPAHVHYCRILANRLMDRGWSCLFTTKDKQIVLYMLEFYGFNYVSCGKHKKGLTGKVLSLVSYTLKLFLVARKFNPDYFFNASPSAAFTSWVLGKIHISLEDTFNMEQVRLYLPFTNVVLIGDYPHPYLGKKELKYPGYHELAYLHPNIFTPDEKILDRLGVYSGEKYVIVRFVAWNASHDLWHQGLSLDNKLKLIEALSTLVRVFISSEDELPYELLSFQIKIRPEDMHNALFFAHLFVGESATMASEAAIMGTPAIFMNNKHFGCIDDQAKYGVLYQFSESKQDQISFIKKAVELASRTDNLEYQRKADQMVKEKLDLSAFLLWFVENYPNSEKEMRKGDFVFDRFR